MTTRVLVVSTDHVGSKMAGPGIRSYRFAQELAKRFEVTLVIPYETDLELDGVEIVQDNPYHASRMTTRTRGYDVVVAQRLPVPTMAALAARATRTIYDLYAPVTIESLAFDAEQARSREAELAFRLNLLTQRVVLATGDAFICASEKQRDLWLGSLLALGRIDHDAYARDRSLRKLIDIVPFGCESEPPLSNGAVVKGVVPGIATTDKLLLWGGGIWNWFDPLTPIRAVERLAERRDDVRLYFLGLKHPNPDVPAMAMTARAVELAEELGLRDRNVFFNFDWVPYAERGAYLLEADLGVSAHLDQLETRFAFRMRLVDCFWAQLPVVTTVGDTLGDLVGERELGRTVAVGDIDGWVAAIEELLDDEDAYSRARASAAAVRAELAWPRAVEPLTRLVAAVEKSSTSRGAARRAMALYAAERVRFAFASRGVLGIARRAATGAAARASRHLRALGLR